VIPTSLAVGYAVFGELPDPISVAGIALIAASGLYTIRREQVRRRQAADRAAPPLAGPRP
jgi:drug/metabolite transporter (DMT)-like permease